MAGDSGTWQKAKSTKGSSKPGGVIELAPPARAVAVVQFGGLPQIDVHAQNMAPFIAKNYGTPGAKAKKFTLDNGDVEMRRVVAASGNGPLNIIADVKSAAAALKKDKAQSKVVVLVLHGNDEGLSRIFRHGYLEDMLNVEQLRSVALHEMELSRLRKEKARYQAALTEANAKHDAEAADDAKFKVEDTQRLISSWENDPRNADSARMSRALQSAAAALEESAVDVIELQACNVAQIDGVATFSFAGRFERLLSTPTHSIKIRTHRRYVSTRNNKDINKIETFLGPDPEAKNNELSTTTLPPFVDP